MNLPLLAPLLGALLAGLGFAAAWLARGRTARALRDRLAARSRELALHRQGIFFLGRINNLTSTLRDEDQLASSVVQVFCEGFPGVELNLHAFDTGRAARAYADGKGLFPVLRAAGPEAEAAAEALMRHFSGPEAAWAGPLFLPAPRAGGLHIACVPLIAEESLVGAMVLRTREPLGEGEKAFYFDVSRQVALALQTVRAHRRTGELRAAFARAVDSRVAEKLLTAPADLGGTTMDATALFLDIRDFTSFSELNDPGFVVARLNDFFLHMEGCVAAEGGLINKFLGDGFMALFGATAERADHAACALRAAAAMVARTREGWNADRGFRIGIGVASGPMLVGTVGTPKRLEFTAIGDTVNTASRLEAQNKARGTLVLASRATVDAARAALGNEVLATRVAGDIALKGKASSVEIHEVLEVGGVRITR